MRSFLLGTQGLRQQSPFRGSPAPSARTITYTGDKAAARDPSQWKWDSLVARLSLKRGPGAGNGASGVAGPPVSAPVRSQRTRSAGSPGRARGRRASQGARRGLASSQSGPGPRRRANRARVSLSAGRADRSRQSLGNRMRSASSRTGEVNGRGTAGPRAAWSQNEWGRTGRLETRPRQGGTISTPSRRPSDGPPAAPSASPPEGEEAPMGGKRLWGSQRSVPLHHAGPPSGGQDDGLRLCGRTHHHPAPPEFGQRTSELRLQRQ